MKNECGKIRDWIAECVGRPLDAARQSELEKHCAECESCRDFRERLEKDAAEMGELASCEAPRIRDLERRAIAAVATASPARENRARFAARPMRLPRLAAIAATAAAAIVLIVAIDLIRGGHNGAVPAFADVQEKMKQFNTYSNRTRSWDLGGWTTSIYSAARGGFSRIDNADSTVVYHDRESDRPVRLVLYRAEKRAVIERHKSWRPSGDSARVAPRARGIGPMDAMGNLGRGRQFAFVRKERLGGRNTAVYEMRIKPDNRLSSIVWVDLKTNLPVRSEIFSKATENQRHSPYYGLRLSDFLTNGSKPKGWIDLKEGEPTAIMDDFKWSTSIDTSFFSDVPPAGYRVEVHTYEGNYVDGGSDVAQCLAEGLCGWLRLSGNAFPDDLNDLRDSTRVKPLLLQKYRRGENPVKEFRSAYSAAVGLHAAGSQALYFLEDRRPPSWTYLGKGAAFGDPKKIIFWMKYGEEPYCIIYADLHVATSVAAPTPARE